MIERLLILIVFRVSLCVANSFNASMASLKSYVAQMGCMSLLPVATSDTNPLDLQDMAGLDSAESKFAPDDLLNSPILSITDQSGLPLKCCHYGSR